MNIPKTYGNIHVFDTGIIHSTYHDGTVVTEQNAREELVTFEKIAAQYGGRLLFLNDLRRRITTDRGARRVFGTYDGTDVHIAFVIDSKIVEIGLNFITKLYGSRHSQHAFPTFDEAYAWLEARTLPEFFGPAAPLTP